MHAPSAETLAAESAIRRLVSAYCDAVGRLDADDAGRLFAEDARLRIADFPELRGRTAITEGMRQTFALSSLLHQSCDTGLIVVEGATAARARLTVFELNRRPGQDAIGVILGIYEDRYACTGEGWRFAERRYTLRARALVPADRISIAAPFVPAFGVDG